MSTNMKRSQFGNKHQWHFLGRIFASWLDNWSRISFVLSISNQIRCSIQNGRWFDIYGSSTIAIRIISRENAWIVMAVASNNSDHHRFCASTSFPETLPHRTKILLRTRKRSMMYESINHLLRDCMIFID